MEEDHFEWKERLKKMEEQILEHDLLDKGILGNFSNGKTPEHHANKMSLSLLKFHLNSVHELQST